MLIKPKFLASMGYHIFLTIVHRVHTPSVRTELRCVGGSGWGACLEILRSRVRDTLWPLVEFVPGSPWFNFAAALVNSQLVCLRPVGILNSCCFMFCSVVTVFHWP